MDGSTLRVGFKVFRVGEGEDFVCCEEVDDEVRDFGEDCDESIADSLD